MDLLRKTLLAGAAGTVLILAGCSPADTDTTPTVETGEAPTEPVETAREDLPPLGAPVMWTVADEDTTVHMFGTVHILKPETEWRTDELDAALASADAIVFEADVYSEAAQANMFSIVSQLGVFTDGTTLSSLLDEDQLREVQEAADIVDVSLDSLEPFQPWLASFNLSNSSMIQQGFDPNSGVEVVLRQEAIEAGIEIRFLETAEQQLRIFAGLSQEDQIEMLVTGSMQIEDNPTMLDDLVEDWVTGDLDDVALLIADPESVGSDAILDALLVDRNENWNEQIQTLMQDEAGTFLYAVGAAHLIGDDSVIAMLRADGFEVSGP